MAQLQFPPNPNPGDQYTGDNGVTYIYDGIKWVGHAPNVSPGTNSIANAGHTVQVDPTGNLVIPDGATIVYESGGNVVTGADTGVVRFSSNIIYTAQGQVLYISPSNDGHNQIIIPSTGNGGDFPLTLTNGDGNVVIQTGSDGHQWTFDTSGNLTVPQGTVLGYSDPGGFIIDAAGNKDVEIYTYNDSTAHGWTFGTDGYLTMESLHLQGYLKGVDGSTGSTGQVLTRQSNGGAAWADATGGSGGPVFQLTSGTAVVSLNTSGALTLPLGSQLLEKTWSTTVTAITTGTRTFVTFAADEFGYAEQGQITISGVNAPTNANSTWYYQASDPNQVELHYNEDFASPVDSTSWNTYTSGGTVTLITQLQLNSNGNIWKFMADGSTIVPNGQRVIFGEQNGGSYIQAGMGFHINSTEGISLEAVDLTNPAAPVSHGWYFSPYGTLTVPGGVTLNTENGLVAPEGGYSQIGDYDLNNFVWVDSGGAYISTNYNESANIWTFDQDGFLTLPLSTKINSGGIDTTNSVEFGTVVATDPFPPNQGVANITNSEIYMSGGSAETRIITDSTSGSLIYTGVEHVEIPAFAGLVAVDTGVSSQYSITVDQYGNIQLGATQESGVLTTDDYTVGVGTLNYSNTINGILANTQFTYIEGSTGISMKTDRGQVWFGNQPEPGGPTHWHIMKGDYNVGNMDLFLGDDTNYVKLPASEDRVIINSGNSQWQFDQYGGTTLPNGSAIYVDPANTNIVAPLQNVSIYTNEADGWSFQPDQGLRFPDNTVQYTAWDWRNLENIDMDGGSASTVYSVNVRFAEGGAAATRFSASDPQYNGANAYGTEPEFTLDGGRA